MWTLWVFPSQLQQKFNSRLLTDLSYFSGRYSKTIAVHHIYMASRRTVSSSSEGKMTELHLCHYPQPEIVAALKTDRHRVSRRIQEFHRLSLIPEAVRSGRPCKRPTDVIVFIETRTLQNQSLS
jgi:hypothetical protein